MGNGQVDCLGLKLILFVEPLFGSLGSLSDLKKITIPVCCSKIKLTNHVM